MYEVTHKNGNTAVVQQFSNLREKQAVASGYVEAVNAYNRMQTQQDGILRPTLLVGPAHRAIEKQHNKFYGLDNKYDGKGNLR